MAEDTRIDEVKTTLDAIKADDIAEDAAYESQIVTLQGLLTAVTAERDQLASERAATIADLIKSRDSLSARITALGG